MSCGVGLGYVFAVVFGVMLTLSLDLNVFFLLNRILLVCVLQAEYVGCSWAPEGE